MYGLSIDRVGDGRTIVCGGGGETITVSLRVEEVLGKKGSRSIRPLPLSAFGLL